MRISFAPWMSEAWVLDSSRTLMRRSLSCGMGMPNGILFSTRDASSWAEPRFSSSVPMSRGEARDISTNCSQSSSSRWL